MKTSLYQAVVTWLHDHNLGSGVRLLAGSAVSYYDPDAIAVLFVDQGALARVFDASRGGSEHLIKDFDEEVLKPLGMVGNQVGDGRRLVVYYVGERNVLSNPQRSWWDEQRRKTLKKAYKKGTRLFPFREAALRDSAQQYPELETEWWSRRRSR